MPRPKRGETYCKSFSVVCSKLRQKMKKYSNGLIGCLDYGKDVMGDSDDLVTFLGILSEFSYCGAPGVARYYKDWCSNPLTLIALSDERDLLEKCIDYYFASITSLKIADSHTLHTIALFLLHRLHEDLQCPRQVYSAYFQAHGHYTPGNYTAVAARVRLLRNVRTSLIKTVKTVALFASVSRAGSVSPFKGAKKIEFSHETGPHPTPVTAPHSAAVRGSFAASSPSPSSSFSMPSATPNRRTKHALSGAGTVANGLASPGKRFQSSFFSSASVCPNSVAQNNLIHETYDKIRRQARMTIQMTKFREVHKRPPAQDDMDLFLEVAASNPARFASRMSFLVEEESDAGPNSSRAFAAAPPSAPKPVPMVPVAPVAAKPSHMVKPRRMSSLVSVSDGSGSDESVPENQPRPWRQPGAKAEDVDVDVDVDDIALAVKRIVRFVGNGNLTVNTTAALDLGSPIFSRHRTEQGQGKVQARSSSLSPRAGGALSAFSLGVLVRRKVQVSGVKESGSSVVEQLVPSIRGKGRGVRVEDFQAELLDDSRLATSRAAIMGWIAQVPWQVRSFRFNGFILFDSGVKPVARPSTVMSPTRSAQARMGKAV